MSTGTVHKFRDSLAKSEQTASASWWTQIYHEYFGPGFVEAVQMPEDTRANAWALTELSFSARAVYSGSTKKVRHGSYGDVLLGSPRGDGPGWVCKATLTDFVVYVTLGLRCAGVEVDALQRAWRTCGEKWKALYGVKIAENATYSSRSVAVIFHELLAAMRQCSELRGIERGFDQCLAQNSAYSNPILATASTWCGTPSPYG